jgi:hypothetical protein
MAISGRDHDGTASLAKMLCARFPVLHSRPDILRDALAESRYSDSDSGES